MASARLLSYRGDRLEHLVICFVAAKTIYKIPLAYAIL